jgi:hypothetical protein
MDFGLAHFETNPGGVHATTGRVEREIVVYHTTGDTVEVIEPEVLELVANTAVQVIRRLGS